jgi:hypothetical protein
MEWFRQYDEMRMGLADEVLQSIDDSLVETHIDTLMKRVQPIDLNLLELVYTKGMIHSRDIDKEMGEDGRMALIRCKSRGLLVPVRVQEHWYKYDITPLGIDLIKKMKEKPTEEVKVTQP